MAADKNEYATGPQKKPFNYFAEQGRFEYRGMYPDGNPASVPVNGLRVLINGRLQGGQVVARPGQAKLNSSALDSATTCIGGLFDFQVGTRKSIMVIGDGCPAISSAVGFYLGLYDFDQSPAFQPQIYYNAATQRLAAGVYGDDLYLGLDNELKRYQAIDAGYGESALAISGSSQDIPILTLPAGFTLIPALQQFDGLLFIACEQGVGTSKVISWDGKTERDDVTGINAPTGFGLYRETLIMGYGGAPNRIDIRQVGDSPGTWTNVAPGAGTAAFKKGTSYKDLFYFTTGGEDLFSYNGTALTRITPGTTGIAAGSVTFGIATFNGFLYVAYTTATNIARLAKFNGTVWTAIEKDFTSQFATVTAARPMALYRGNLVVGAVQSGGPSGGVLLESPGTSTSGTWTRRTASLANNGDIDDILVY